MFYRSNFHNDFSESGSFLLCIASVSVFQYALESPYVPYTRGSQILLHHFVGRVGWGINIPPSFSNYIIICVWCCNCPFTVSFKILWNSLSDPETPLFQRIYALCSFRKIELHPEMHILYIRVYIYIYIESHITGSFPCIIKSQTC